jgi:hypothetical protein
MYTVGIFRHIKSNTIILNAMSLNEIGVAQATNRIILIEHPVNAEELGSKFIELISYCMDNPYLTLVMGDGKLEALLGYKSFSKFQKEHIHVTSELSSDKVTLNLNSTRHVSGGFIGIEYEENLELSNKTDVGNSIIRALDNSR